MAKNERRVIKVDLREREEGCREHPILTFREIMDKMIRGEVDRVIVTVDTRTTPLFVVKAITKRMNLSFRILDQNDSRAKIEITRK
ncbi:MAG: hypothetical protein DRJ66_04615 [Thermoprotei archaeon]|nr:MAG: hypothetical protein DRJ66_04615 [Thermoprotei archaeon]RLF18523.1 MAG: hypothetical protein DRZ82_08085 [Thermoprotei archaeon]